MQDEADTKAIDGLKAAVAAMNEALAVVGDRGIVAEVDTEQFWTFGRNAHRVVVTVHLTRSRVELDTRI